MALPPPSVEDASDFTQSRFADSGEDDDPVASSAAPVERAAGFAPAWALWTTERFFGRPPLHPWLCAVQSAFSTTSA
eukprot:8201435-Lingulodinium_polyedra.AAC.1